MAGPEKPRRKNFSLARSLARAAGSLLPARKVEGSSSELSCLRGPSWPEIGSEALRTDRENLREDWRRVGGDLRFGAEVFADSLSDSLSPKEERATPERK